MGRILSDRLSAGVRELALTQVVRNKDAQIYLIVIKLIVSHLIISL